MRSASRLLRQVHDATTDWPRPDGVEWAVPEEGGPVMCHGDPKPANFAWSAGRVTGLFDWDVARPATRESDVAYALYWFAPFDADRAERRRRWLDDGAGPVARIEAFLDGYGWARDHFDVTASVARRRRLAIAEVEHLARAGLEPYATWTREGLVEAEDEPPRLLPGGDDHDVSTAPR